MIFPLLLAIIGFAAMLSGVWEQNMLTIAVGVVMQLVGWVWFYVAWRKAKKEAHKKE